MPFVAVLALAASAFRLTANRSLGPLRIGTATVCQARITALVRTGRRSAGSRSSFAGQQTATPRWRRVTALVASATALLTLAAWLRLRGFRGSSTPGSWAGSICPWLGGLHLPLAVDVLGASVVVLAVSGWIGRWWSRAVTLQYAALAVAAVALGARLARWHLIGWGMT